MRSVVARLGKLVFTPGLISTSRSALKAATSTHAPGVE